MQAQERNRAGSTHEHPIHSRAPLLAVRTAASVLGQRETSDKSKFELSSRSSNLVQAPAPLSR